VIVKNKKRKRKNRASDQYSVRRVDKKTPSKKIPNLLLKGIARLKDNNNIYIYSYPLKD
jgi:hypothetical protein